jgi:hypothetical protein
MSGVPGGALVHLLEPSLPQKHKRATAESDHANANSLVEKCNGALPLR